MILYQDSFKKRLNNAKKYVVKKFNRGKPGSWLNKDFEDLCFEINKTTRVLISTATLKRIFGKNKTHERYTPQEATLEALEKYSGALIKKHQLNTTTNFRKWVFYLSSLLIACFLLIFILNYREHKYNDVKSVLKFQKIVGISPSSVYFEYQIPELKDSIFIDYGISDFEETLDPKNNHISQIYRYPGMFETKIKTRKKILSNTVKVFIPTNGWQALAGYYNQPYTERYFPVPFNGTISNGAFHPNRKFLASIGMDSTKITILRIDNYRNTETNGDSFLLKSKIKSINYWPAIRCYSAYVRVSGENGRIQIKFTNSGCSGWGECTLSENIYQGQYHDLSCFSIDMKKWNDIQIKNENKLVSVFINNDKVFEKSYEKTIGKICGASIIFHGSGFVDFIDLRDSENQIVFAKDF